MGGGSVATMRSQLDQSTGSGQQQRAALRVERKQQHSGEDGGDSPAQQRGWGGVARSGAGRWARSRKLGAVWRS